MNKNLAISFYLFWIIFYTSGAFFNVLLDEWLASAACLLIASFFATAMPHPEDDE